MQHTVVAKGPWEYFSRKVRWGLPDQCWDWMGSCRSTGYGGWSHRRSADAHRVAYELFYGEIPAGAHILHRCGRRCCCNPNHLYAGNPKDNYEDSRRHGTNNQGSRHGMAKLTEASVLAIKKDPRTHRLIALDYGVSRVCVYKIKTGKSWSYLDETSR